MVGVREIEGRGRQMSMQLLAGLISMATMEGARAKFMPKTVPDRARDQD